MNSMPQRPTFSARTAWDISETELAQAIAERRKRGLPLLDLTASNPTRCGFIYEEPAILSALSDRDSLVYDPDPRGMLRAREAVAGYYADHGAALDPANLVLTTSTSEAYSYLFHLLCDPGDEVLIAQPSYPLFDFLAQLENVRLVPYPLFYDHGWHIDAGSMRRQITSKTRAIALVHPNNPTGHFTKDDERHELEGLCAEHGLALIVDEVFLDYSIAGHTGRSFACGPHPVLTFVLSGLSKIAALPQMKAAWIAAFGPEPDLSHALNRLEVIGDTFLSMNAPIQHALPDWLAGRTGLQAPDLPPRGKQSAQSRLADRIPDDDLAARSRGWLVCRSAGAGADIWRRAGSAAGPRARALGSSWVFLRILRQRLAGSKPAHTGE